MGRRAHHTSEATWEARGLARRQRKRGKLWVRAFLVVFMKRQMRQGKRASEWLAEYFQCSGGIGLSLVLYYIYGHRLIKFHLAGG